MKWLIASDIHGSSHYCDKLMKAFEQENAEQLILLGDLLYHGPRNALPKDYNPKEVARMLNEKKEYIACVRGNCDSEVDQMMLQFPIMAEYAVFVTPYYRIYATHGHKLLDGNNTNAASDIDVNCSTHTGNNTHINGLQYMQKNDILLYGHTHVPKHDICDGVMRINPGSVSIPKENSPHTYLIMENDKFVWKDLETEKSFII